MHAHHKLIRNLIARIRELQSENEALNAYMEFQERAIERSRKQAEQYKRDAEYYREQVTDYEWRNSEAERLTRRLEEAKRYGNEYEVERLSKQVRRTLRGW